MKKSINSALFIATLFGATTFAQDWYHDRDARYRDEHWRAQVFLQVRSDLEHIGSANGASEKERRRLDTTRQELSDLQAGLDHGRFDNGHLNDVIDSIRKSSNDERLSARDRDVLRDDMNRLKDYQNNHNHWKR